MLAVGESLMLNESLKFHTINTHWHQVMDTEMLDKESKFEADVIVLACKVRRTLRIVFFFKLTNWQVSRFIRFLTPFVAFPVCMYACVYFLVMFFCFVSPLVFCFLRFIFWGSNRDVWKETPRWLKRFLVQPSRGQN